MKKLDIQPGEKFGNATAISTRINFHGHTVVELRCDCGNTFGASGARLRNGKVKQCPKCSRPVLDRAERKLRQRESAYHHKAKQRGYAWELDRNAFRKLLEDPCHYCGIGSAGGIDRQNNAQGYTILNSVACCKDCNYAKLNKTEDEFFDWLRRIVQYQGICG